MRKYFGTDGVRGLVGEFPMTPDFAMKLGWAAGQVLGAQGVKEVIIGKDTRASGYMLESALEAGFSAAGVNVALVGPLPTPAVAYLTSTFRADAGVVISASHNPFHDNGIKIFGQGGFKLSDAQEQEIERFMHIAIEGGMTCVSSEQLGKARRVDDAAGRYIEYCKANLSSGLSLSGLKIVVDSANGAAYKVAPAVYRELGATVVSIHDQPNGMNINAGCGATAMGSLQAAVLDHKADLGIALDGDADRLMMVDHTGTIVDGDELLYLLVRDAKENGYTGGVVGTQMSNMGLKNAFDAIGVPFKRAKVGDRYVFEQLNVTGWRFGGEASGHLLCLDYAMTGDAVIASLRVFSYLLKNNTSLSDAKRHVKKLPQVLINVRLTSGQIDELLKDPALDDLVHKLEEELGKSGRILLRKSGTESLVRVMVEAESEESANLYATKIAGFFV